MVQAEILLSLTLASIGAYLHIGVVRGPARRGRGPAGVRAELTTTTGDRPDGEAAPATAPRATASPARVVGFGAAPAAPAHPPVLPAPDVPVRSSSAAPAAPAPGLSNGVRNSRFSRYDRSGRPAAMGSPYLR
jgi:hypothetical protein